MPRAAVLDIQTSNTGLLGERVQAPHASGQQRRTLWNSPSFGVHQIGLESRLCHTIWGALSKSPNLTQPISSLKGEGQCEGDRECLVVTVTVG